MLDAINCSGCCSPEAALAANCADLLHTHSGRPAANNAPHLSRRACPMTGRRLVVGRGRVGDRHRGGAGARSHAGAAAAWRLPCSGFAAGGGVHGGAAVGAAQRRGSRRAAACHRGRRRGVRRSIIAADKQEARSSPVAFKCFVVISVNRRESQAQSGRQHSCSPQRLTAH